MSKKQRINRIASHNTWICTHLGWAFCPFRDPGYGVVLFCPFGISCKEVTRQHWRIWLKYHL